MPFDDAFNIVVGVEGDYSDDPQDSGGATRFGITEQTARANGYTGDMRDLPFETARAIYRSEYWDKLSLDDIEQVSDRVAFELFDTGVNTGIYWSAWWLQRVLNVFNKGGTIYPDIATDAKVGRETIVALRRYVDIRKDEGIDVLLKSLNCFQGTYYLQLAEQRVKDERFVYGWILNRVAL